MSAHQIYANIDDHQQLAQKASKIWSTRQVWSYANLVYIELSTPKQIFPATSDVDYAGEVTSAVQL